MTLLDEVIVSVIADESRRWNAPGFVDS